MTAISWLNVGEYEADPDGRVLRCTCIEHRILSVVAEIDDEADDGGIEMAHELHDFAIAWLLEQHTHSTLCALCPECWPEPDDGRDPPEALV